MDEDGGRGTCRYPRREEPWKCLLLSLPKLYRTREVLYVQGGGGTVSHRVPPPFPLFPGVKESPSPHLLPPLHISHHVAYLEVARLLLFPLLAPPPPPAPPILLRRETLKDS